MPVPGHTHSHVHSNCPTLTQLSHSLQGHSPSLRPAGLGSPSVNGAAGPSAALEGPLLLAAPRPPLQSPGWLVPGDLPWGVHLSAGALPYSSRTPLAL